MNSIPLLMNIDSMAFKRTSPSTLRVLPDHDIIVERLGSDELKLNHYRAYANPAVHGPDEVLVFMNIPVERATPESWERALGLVVCGLATRYQK